MRQARKKRHAAFTLIELLVVIAIIAIVAGLAVNMVGAAKRKQHESQVSAARQALMIMIDNYQSRLNFYPPDNGYLTNANTPAFYDAITTTNPLLYELTGATNNYSGASMFVFNSIVGNNSTYIPQVNYNQVFLRTSVANGNSDEPHTFYLPPPRLQDYTNYAAGIYGLLVPVTYGASGLTPNFWHYDSSTTNRHNQNSYDLWAEYTEGTNIMTNGNW